MVNFTVKGVTEGLIGIVIIFALAAALIPEAITSGNSLNDTGIKFGSFFADGGLVWTLLAVALLLGVMKLFQIGKGKM